MSRLFSSLHDCILPAEIITFCCLKLIWYRSACPGLSRQGDAFMPRRDCRSRLRGWGRCPSPSAFAISSVSYHKAVNNFAMVSGHTTGSCSQGTKYVPTLIRGCMCLVLFPSLRPLHRSATWYLGKVCASNQT